MALLLTFCLKFFPKLFVAFFSAITILCYRVHARQGKISYQMKVGYHSPTHELAKHIVSLRFGDENGVFGVKHICGGTILSERVVVTSAHCALTDSGYERDMEKFIVAAGTPHRLQKSNFSTEHKVKRILPYPNYDTRIMRGDLALLYLKEPLEEDNVHIQRISLRTSKAKPGESCIVYGWGEVIPRGPVPDELVYTNVTILKPENCRENYKLTKGVVCAGIEDGSGRDTGVGDSGGPLVCNNQLTGIVSYAVEIILPSFYSDVWYYRDWILKNGSVTLDKCHLYCLVVIVLVKCLLNR